MYLRSTFVVGGRGTNTEQRTEHLHVTSRVAAEQASVEGFVNSAVSDVFCCFMHRSAPPIPSPRIGANVKRKLAQTRRDCDAARSRGAGKITTPLRDIDSTTR